MHDRHGAMGQAEAPLTPDDLERERLLTYLDWARAKVPSWYWPVYGAGVTAWIASYQLGRVWGTVGALLFAALAGVLIRYAVACYGVGLPRLRGMPRRLRTAYLAVLGVAAVAAAAIAWIVIAVDDPPYALIGLVVGPAIALAGAAGSRAYRNVATRLADEHGIAR